MYARPVSMSSHPERRLQPRANFDVHELNDAFAPGHEHVEKYGTDRYDVNNHVVDDNSWGIKILKKLIKEFKKMGDDTGERAVIAKAQNTQHQSFCYMRCNGR